MERKPDSCSDDSASFGVFEVVLEGLSGDLRLGVPITYTYEASGEVREL